MGPSLPGGQASHFRDVYNAFAKTRTISDQMNGLVRLKSLDAEVQLGKEYNNLNNLVNQGKSPPVEYLTSRNYETARRKNWTSLLIDYVVDDLQVKRTKFTSWCQQSPSTAALAKRFSTGVLILLPIPAPRG